MKRTEISGTTVIDTAAVAGEGRRLYLLVIGDELSATHPLPVTGEVLIGRDPDCDVVIDHPSISRNHARLSIGETIRVRDLGSANGTRVRGDRLEADAAIEIGAGESVDLGTVLALIQRRSRPPSPTRLRTHGYFEGRLEDECARAERLRKGFSVVRVCCSPPLSTRDVEAVLMAATGDGDVAAVYAPGEFELLLVGAAPDEVSDRLGELERQLAGLGADETRVGIASYPADGRTPYALIAKARSIARGVDEDGGVVIRDPAMVQLYRMIDRVAPGSISVLLLGETGVGKEIVARAVHRASPRAAKPLVKLNCAALSETLLESELFGHEKGAFTGAARTKPGLLETADGGTVFLDEVGELPLSIQVKLLRVLEEREVLRVGGLKPHAIDVRFVAATNRDLEAEVAAGTFRQDLFFRLNGVTLVIPSLRERTSEIEPLATTFVEQAASEIGLERPPEIGEEALALLSSYDWPGNIRELRNVMERAVLLCTGEAILPAHLPGDSIQAAPRRIPRVAPLAEGGDERQRIIDALANCGGNQTRAAELLGISRRTLTNWLNRHDIPRPKKGR